MEETILIHGTWQSFVKYNHRMNKSISNSTSCHTQKVTETNGLAKMMQIDSLEHSSTQNS